MKKILVLTIMLVSIVACKNSAKDVDLAEVSFGVRGNCGMCKSTIEKAAKSVDGVETAEWKVDEKIIHVSFEAEKTNELAIHKAIAASGYDTSKENGNEDAYLSNPKCCHYDRDMVIK